MHPRRIRVLAAAAAGAVLATLVLPAAPASAHVSVSPGQVAQGGFAALAFRVPNEREESTTTQVEVYFPQDTPIIAATVRKMTGWKSEVVRGKLPAPVTVDGNTLTQAVTKVVWTAESAGDAIGGSDYQEFGVSVGPLPKTDRVIFKSLQTYADGHISRWIEIPADGGPEPDSPAVVLRLTASGGEQLDSHGMPVVPGSTTEAVAPGSSTQVAREAAPSNVALAVAIAALVVAVAALLLILVGRLRGPRREV